ncbi:hypothetical protein JOE11_005194 [Robbsia andropogonis]|uniref:DUF4062 domain-containing protein n=1 Tax=Robbsia andropogonis TaxID=28092 RepID=UPI003D1F2308
MKIFISSLISGFESYREAAKSAILTLRHEPVMAEDFGAQPNSPQIACLQGLRRADLVILLLGHRYGYAQGSSGVSPTHEEFLEAKPSKPILVFVQDGSTHREPAQADFISEVQGWENGYFREAFSTPDQLKELVIRAVHDYQLANVSGPVDTDQLIRDAVKLLPSGHGRQNHSGSQMLNVAFVGGPSQTILRPSELEAPTLAKDLHRHALFDEPALFDGAQGVKTGLEESVLVLSQDRGARIELNEQGSLLLQLPLLANRADRSGFGALSIVEEDVLAQLLNAAACAVWVLDRIDATQRITEVAVAASIDAHDYAGWKTQAEMDASRGSSQTLMGSGSELKPVHTHRKRAALRIDAKAIAEDLMVLLRRQRSRA